MSDRETLDVYDARAAEYDALVDDEAPDEQLAAFLAALPDAASVWDLGCGPGRSAAMMAGRGHRVRATDASAEMVAIASKRPGVTALRESFDEIAGVEIYDGIFANFSLLHAKSEDLPRHLRALAQALKSAGIFHIGMKLGEGTKRDPIGRRYTYVTEDGLRSLLANCGLTPTQVWFGETVGLDGVTAPFIIMHALKDG